MLPNAPHLPARIQEILNSRPTIEKIRAGVTRLSLPYTSGFNIQGTIPLSGKAIVYPRAENGFGELLKVWPGRSSAAESEGYVELNRGAKFAIPFREGAIYVRKEFPIPQQQALSNGVHTATLVLYILDDPDIQIEDPVEAVSAADGWHPSAYLYNWNGTANVFAIDAAGDNRGNAIGAGKYTSAPNANDLGFVVDRVKAITFAVLDGNATSSVGTILRPWWNLPNLTTAGLVANEAAGVGAGWVPDSNTFTVASRGRIFTMLLNVSPGYSPSSINAISGIGLGTGGQAGALYAATGAYGRGSSIVPSLSGVQMTFEATSIPAGALPRLIMIGAAMA